MTIDKAVYEGAMEDKNIWKKRALEAEATVIIYNQRIIGIGVLAMKPIIKLAIAPQNADTKDAERYRYLKNVKTTGYQMPFIARIFAQGSSQWSGESADKIIDQAIENEKPTHDLYKDGDENIPDFILDRTGQVALGLCKKCGKGEVELTEPCEAKNE